MISDESESSLCYYIKWLIVYLWSLYLGLNLKDSLSDDNFASYLSEKMEAIHMHPPPKQQTYLNPSLYSGSPAVTGDEL